jgi:hypothetical protein
LKILRIIVLLLFFCIPVRANTITAASCSATDVQTAVNSAVDRDTVNVPGPCTAAWSGSPGVNIAKGITLNGGGNVTLTTNFSIQMASSATVSARVTGFILASTTDDTTNGEIKSTGSSTTGIPYRIDHNTFSTARSCGIAAWSNAPGLIDHNTFTAGAATEVIHNFGLGAGQTGGWADDILPGGPNMVFVEYNTFNNSDPTFIAQAIESYYGARTVFRNNQLNFTAFDAHGNSGTLNGVSARWWEVYQNNIDALNRSQCCYITLRGGNGVVWGNAAVNNNVTGALHFKEDIGDGFAGTCTPPDPDLYHVGRGINSTLAPAYAWGNLPSNMNVFGDGCIRSGTEYLASTSQPATLTRCESAADVSAGCPVSYSYVPYTNPHPLVAATPGWAFLQDSVITYCTVQAPTATCNLSSAGNIIPTTAGSVWVIQVNTPNNVTISSISGGGGTWTLCPASSCHSFNSTLGANMDFAYNLSGNAGTFALTINLSGSSGSYFGGTFFELMPPPGSTASFDVAGNEAPTSCSGQTCSGVGLTLAATDAVIEAMNGNAPLAWNSCGAVFFSAINGDCFYLNAPSGALSAPPLTVKTPANGFALGAIAFTSTLGSFTAPSTSMSLVNSTATHSTSLSCNPGCTLNIPSPAIGAGHLLYLESDNLSGPHISSVSGGGTWVAPAGCISTIPSTSHTISCAYVLSSTAGATSLSITMSGNATTAFGFSEIATTGAAFTLDAVANATNSASFSPGGILLTLSGTNDAIFQSIAVAGGTSGASWYPLSNDWEFSQNNAASAFLLNAPSSLKPFYANEQNSVTAVAAIAFSSASLPITQTPAPAPVMFTGFINQALGNLTVK